MVSSSENCWYIILGGGNTIRLAYSTQQKTGRLDRKKPILRTKGNLPQSLKGVERNVSECNASDGFLSY